MAGPLTLAEAAARLHKSKRWLQDWLAENPVDAAGRPFCSKLGRTALFREGDIERLEQAIKKIENRPTYLYFIELQGHIKIGRADNWKKRLHSVQTNSPFQARLLLAIKGTDGRERALHELFKAHRVRGEWFVDHPEIREYIRRRKHRCMTKTSGRGII
jgi:hypothetical protein